MVADQDVYIVNTAGSISLLDPATGEPKWTQRTQGGRLAAASGNKLYLRSYNLDLFVMDRKTGQTLLDPGETHTRIGLNLRDYDLDVVNRFHDRLYFATASGLVVCLREAGLPQPRLLKDPKAHPFGYVPPEGLKPTPPLAPAAAAKAEGADEAAPPPTKTRKRKNQPRRPMKKSRRTHRSKQEPDGTPLIPNPLSRCERTADGQMRGLSLVRGVLSRTLGAQHERDGRSDSSRTLQCPRQARSDRTGTGVGGQRHSPSCQRRYPDALVASGIHVTEVAEYTGQPEVLGGRVKTLHPKIHGGILARRDEPEDLATLERHDFPPIDLVVVNLYPFEATVARAG